jgi:hypothetical protein
MTTSSDQWANDVKAAIRAGWSYDMAAAPLLEMVLVAIQRKGYAGYPRVVAAYRASGGGWQKETVGAPLRGFTYAWRPLLQPPPLPEPQP